MGLTTALLLFLSTFDSAYLAVGQGRYVSTGLVDDLNGIFKSRYELGYQPNPSSFYGAYQVGLVASNDTIYADFFTGPSLLTHTNIRPSSPIEFKHDVGIGVVGENKVGIGINYSHLSNSIKQSNAERNSIQLKFILPIK